MDELTTKLRRMPIWAWLTTLAVIGIGQRALLAAAYGPVSFGDTPTYFRLSKVLMERGLNAYDATRVPGYPLFIGLFGQQENAVWIAQLTFGLLTSLALFYIGFCLTQSAPFAFAAGIAYDLIAGVMLFEFNLLSESLTTFLLIGSMALFAWLLERRIDVWQLLGVLLLGLIASLTGLTRTMFFFLPVILLPFVMMLSGNWQQRVLLAGIFSVGPLLLLGGWIYFVYDHYGMLSPTTMGGYHLVQHTGAFFEELPESEATIRDIYLQYRNEQIAERGVQTNVIWDAIPALSQATGLSFFALSEKLQELSVQLIVENPLLYARSVIEGWISFWKAPVYWKADQMAGGLAQAVRLWSLIGRGIAILANGLFLLLSTGSLIWSKLRHRLEPPRFILASTALIWFSSILQTLVDHGDNPRFLVPLQLLLVIVVMWALWKLATPEVRS